MLSSREPSIFRVSSGFSPRQRLAARGQTWESHLSGEDCNKEDHLSEDHRMRRLMRPALMLLLVAAVTLPAIADKAKDLFLKGQDAEARQNYEGAYEFYKQAYDLKPKDLRYRASFERTRFEAAASIVHRGQALRDEGKLDEAVALFQKAVAIDPSLFIAKQE